MTSAEAGRGQEKVREKDEQADCGPALAEPPRAEKLARSARPTFTIYRAGAAWGPAH